MARKPVRSINMHMYNMIEAIDLREILTERASSGTGPSSILAMLFCCITGLASIIYKTFT